MAETERVEWIIKLAKDRENSDQDPEWENKMKRMLQTIRDKATNRELIAIIKGPHQPVQNIDVTEKK